MKHAPTKYQFENIRAVDLQLDGYQREFNPSNPAVSKPWNARKVSALVVSKRADGKYYVIDGQHRRAGAAAVSPNTLLPCLVYEGMTLEEEAQLFRDLAKEKKALGSLDDYNAALVAQDVSSLDIAETLKNAGLKVSRHECKNGIQAVGALKSAQINGNLSAVIQVVKAWREASEDSYAFEGQNIRAVSGFLKDYPEASVPKLVDQLKKVPPSRMISRYKMSKQTGLSAAEATVGNVLAVYNKSNSKPLTQKLK